MSEHASAPPGTLKYLFCQQSQKAWRPVVLPKKSVWLFFGGAIFSLIFGIIFVTLHATTHEYEIRYDDKCPVSVEMCTVKLHIGSDLKGTVKMQYKLTDFHQNHRRLIYSRLYYQLIGDYLDYDDLEAAKPYRSIGDSKDPKDWILPSGAFAVFAYNDTLKWAGPQNFDEDAIVYDEEKNYLFQPLNEKYTVGYKWIENNPMFPGGMTDPHFIVWMRTSAEIPLVKDWAICKNCNIPKGDYEIQIQSNYPTELFGGEKYIVITEMTPMGERNLFLGVAYFVLAGILLAVGLVMVISEITHPREIGLLSVKQ